LDASGDALRLGCQAEPHLVKPNLPEASQIVEFTIDNEEDAKRAALPFLRMGVGYFALTMGSTGLFVASQQEMVYAKPPKVHVRNAAGSGDALMAGIIYGQYQGWTLLDVARWAVATGTASVETEGVSEFEIDRIKEMLPEVEARVSNVM
jgi:fructose-1-phosphate kinase PfkB-like protein